ncbi:MAG: hypothetical protein Q4G60_08005 [bacterium]|nr:hypothetical protein [bacterium]
MKRRGSYTIEAALIMPFIIGSIVFIIYGAYYTHDRAFIQKCAYIAALRGSEEREGDAATYHAAKECSTQLPQGHLLGSWILTDAVQVNPELVTVTYEGTMQISGGVLMEMVLLKDVWYLKREAVARRVDEPRYIRERRKRQN